MQTSDSCILMYQNVANLVEKKPKKTPPLKKPQNKNETHSHQNVPHLCKYFQKTHYAGNPIQL